MSYDWRALAPHRPLEPGAQEYLAPPSGGGEEIARWIRAGGATLLVGGPTGVGKSTELAHAAGLLQEDRVACLVPLDRWENMRRLTADRLLLRIAGRLVSVAGEGLGLPISRDLQETLVKAGVLGSQTVQEPAAGLVTTAPALLRSTLNEVARTSPQGRVTLLLDGLEKVPPGPGALELFDALGSLPESVDLVVVVPWHVAFGPQSELAVRPGEHFKALRALEIEGAAGEPGRSFLKDLLRRRLGDALVDMSPLAEREKWFATVVDAAAEQSGGIVRTFLQLIAGAGTYARLRDAALPDETDLADAMADQQDSFRRALLQGDTTAILAAEGTDGRELDLGQKVRLMAHGVLLERLRNRLPTLEVHPLARATVSRVQTGA
ncbi:MAG: ATP-binding protein [Candidatus Sericytochromatia bacterium]|nr:ATP-binding protein [Candidatus Tanganyikabacteria bacterium]